MTKHLFTHLRQNTIAYFALFIALGGTSYASVKVPQLAAAHKSSKAGITCSGGCPAATVYWSYVGWQGGPGNFPAGPVNANVQGTPSAPAVYQTPFGGVTAQIVHQGVGDWLVYFQGHDLTNCARFANLTHDRGSATVSGYDHFSPDPTAIHVMTTNAAGQPQDMDFVVAALCGKLQTPAVSLTPAAPAVGAVGQP